MLKLCVTEAPVHARTLLPEEDGGSYDEVRLSCPPAKVLPSQE